MFITFEGPDGSGKTTQIHRLADKLRNDGHDVRMTREPGGSPGAEDIRRLLVEGDKDRWSDETEILLFNAARRDHVERTIRPSLENGQIVLCDRFVDSTRAYQGAKSEYLLRMVNSIHEIAIGLEPDLVIILDCPPETGLSAAEARGGGEDRMESKGTAYHQKVREGFLGMCRDDPERYKLVQRSDIQTMEATIHATVYEAIEHRFSMSPDY